MSNLNANATEWRPTGTVMTDLTLPPSTNADPNMAAVATTPPLSAVTPPFYPQSEVNENGEAPPAYYPSFMLPAEGGATDSEGRPMLEEIDWRAEYDKIMDLTAQMIDQQMNPTVEDENGNVISGGVAPATEQSSKVVNLSQVKSGTKSMGGGMAADDKLLPPLTSKGNRRWKKPTKAQQRRDLAQKSAFEAFAGALLHSVSPFMAPLRAKCKTSLPHLKLDQRFGKSGQPQTAVAQFIVAPLVTNYRPRHFHDVTPGDLMEFHYDLALVLRQIKTSYSLVIGYGPVWKRYAVPYCYIACKEYRREVLALCPDEIPNSRSEAIYEDDVIKNITEVVLSVEELEPLQNMSIMQAMSRRMNLAPLYDALDTIFAPIENYQIEIWDLDKVPSTFVLKTSKLEVEQKPQPITLYGDSNLWYDLPVVSRSALQGGGSSSAAGNAAAGGSSGAADGASSSLDAGRRADAGPAGIRKAQHRPKNNAGIPWMTVAPLALSTLCVLATLGIVLSKKKHT